MKTWCWIQDRSPTAEVILMILDRRFRAKVCMRTPNLQWPLLQRGPIKSVVVILQIRQGFCPTNICCRYIAALTVTNRVLFSVCSATFFHESTSVNAHRPQVALMLAARFVQIGLFEPLRVSLRNLVSLQSMWSVAHFGCQHHALLQHVSIFAAAKAARAVTLRKRAWWCLWLCAFVPANIVWEANSTTVRTK